jgi:hypothetical protein
LIYLDLVGFGSSKRRGDGVVEKQGLFVFAGVMRCKFMQIYANLCKTVVARAKTCKRDCRLHEWTEGAAQSSSRFLVEIGPDRNQEAGRDRMWLRSVERTSPRCLKTRVFAVYVCTSQ